MEVPSDESVPEEDQGLGDIRIIHDGTNKRHSVDLLADEIESLGRLSSGEGSPPEKQLQPQAIRKTGAEKKLNGNVGSYRLVFT